MYRTDTEENLDEGWHVIVSLKKHEAENATYFSSRNTSRDLESNSRLFGELSQFRVVSQRIMSM